MIKAVIIDDEQHSIDTLKWKLENYCPEVEIMAAFDKPAEGVNYLKQNPPELLFLDIEMPMLSGFDVLEELGKDLPYDIIFITAYDNFGIQAVKFSALDYLLKPVQNKELKEAIDKHIKKSNPKTTAQQIDVLISNVKAEKKGAVGKIGLASKEVIEFVEAADIIYCEASSNYTTVYMADGKKKVISKTLKEFEEMLTPHNFYRAHNSYLINMKMIKELVRGDGGYIVMANKAKIPVSRNKREDLMNLLS
jgi:two-component system LytT family response regulator